jgi:hypothetical protein
MEPVRTLTAKIYLGLREGYTDVVHTVSELEDFLQGETNKGGLCITVTPTTFIYKDKREVGAIIGFINYPRFPTTKEELEKTAERIARLCKEEYKQKRVSVEYQDRTITLE